MYNFDNGVNVYLKLFLTANLFQVVQGRASYSCHCQQIFILTSPCFQLFLGGIYESSLSLSLSLSLWLVGIHNGFNTSLKKLFLIASLSQVVQGRVLYSCHCQRNFILTSPGFQLFPGRIYESSLSLSLVGWHTYLKLFLTASFSQVVQ